MSAYPQDAVTRKLAVVSAGLGTPSATRLLAGRLAEATTARLSDEGIGTDTTVIELRDHAMAIAGNLVNGFATEELEAVIESLFTYHHATVVPTGVYAATGDWGSPGEGTGAGLPERIGRAAGELAALMRGSARSQQVRDPFALPPGFSPAGTH